MEFNNNIINGVCQDCGAEGLEPALHCCTDNITTTDTTNKIKETNMEENSKTLSDPQFQGFTEQVKESTNRMLHNFITMFIFLGIYESSGEEAKKKIEEFLSVICVDISTIHIKKATVAFELTAYQTDILTKEIDKILTGCLEPITRMIANEKSKIKE